MTPLDDITRGVDFWPVMLTIGIFIFAVVYAMIRDYLKGEWQ